MTVKSFARFALSTTLIALAAQAYAETPPSPELLDRPFNIETNHGTVMAIKPDVGPIETQNKQFTFDWNQYQTIHPNKQNVTLSEKVLAKVNNATKLNSYEQEALGSLLYKLGTYYTHVARKPEAAIVKLSTAAPFLKNKQQKAWNDAQLAYAYEQSYSLSHQSADKEKSLFYANKVITQLYPKQKNALVAFAICMKGLIEGDDKNYAASEKYLKEALAMYNTIGELKDNQYFRIKNRLANALLDQGHDQEGLTMLKQCKKYWSAQGQTSTDLYGARNMLSLGYAFLKMDNNKAANTEFKAAVLVYQNIYGKNTALLVKPYQLLALSYRKLGSLEQASRYEKKANEIVSA